MKLHEQYYVEKTKVEIFIMVFMIVTLIQF